MLSNSLIFPQCRCVEKPELAYHIIDLYALKHEDRRRAHCIINREMKSLVFNHHAQIKLGCHRGLWRHSCGTVGKKTTDELEGECLSLWSRRQALPPEFLLQKRHAPCSLWHQTYSLSLGINSYDSHLAVYGHAITLACSFLLEDSYTQLALVTNKHSFKPYHHRKHEKFVFENCSGNPVNVKHIRKNRCSMVLMHWCSLMHYVVTMEAWAYAFSVWGNWFSTCSLFPIGKKKPHTHQRSSEMLVTYWSQLILRERVNPYPTT